MIGAKRYLYDVNFWPEERFNRVVEEIKMFSCAPPSPKASFLFTIHRRILCTAHFVVCMRWDFIRLLSSKHCYVLGARGNKRDLETVWRVTELLNRNASRKDSMKFISQRYRWNLILNLIRQFFTLNYHFKLFVPNLKYVLRENSLSSQFRTRKIDIFPIEHHPLTILQSAHFTEN